MIVANIKKSLFSDNHTSEGFMVYKDGILYNFFRSSTSLGHVNNDGKIVYRTSTDKGLTWSNVTTIFNDSVDDRNIHGGLTNEGVFVIVFRRFNAVAYSAINTNVIYSTDNCLTWSTPVVVSTSATAAAGTDTMSYIPTKGYMLSFMNVGYIEVRISADGKDWNTGSYYIVANSSNNPGKTFSEVCHQYIGDGKIIMLVRNHSVQTGSMYYQTVSSDYGETWSSLVSTNIHSPHWSPAPKIMYDEDIGKLIVLSSDRRSLYGGSLEDECLKVYSASPLDAFNDPTIYQEEVTIPRPYSSGGGFYGERPLDRVLYGYFNAIKVDASRYIAIFTEGSGGANMANENCDLFQCEIMLDTIQGVGIFLGSEAISGIHNGNIHITKIYKGSEEL